MLKITYCNGWKYKVYFVNQKYLLGWFINRRLEILGDLKGGFKV